MPGLLRRVSFRGSITLAIALSLTVAVSHAQTDRDAKSKNSISDFFDSFAKLTYKSAWPTATYKTWSFDTPVKDVQGGYDVVVKLSGLSGIDGSDLWLKLGFAFRSSGVERVWVVDHNAFWVPPFKTVQTLGQVTAELAKQYQQSQSAHPAIPVPAQPQAPSAPEPSKAAAICVSNGTEVALNFKYRWGDGAWSMATVKPNEANIYWFTLQNGQTTAPRFFIEYDDSFEDGYTPQDSELDRYAASLPVTCSAAKQYLFSSAGKDILLRATN